MLQAGHLVEVPFGRQRVQGVVVGLDDQPPADVPELKEIESLVDVQPVLTRMQLDLAYWLAHYYHAPLIDCVTLMLPPGLAKRAENQYELIDWRYDARSAAELQVIRLLKKRGPLRTRQLHRALPRKNWRRTMERLVRNEAVRKTPVLAPPSVRPKHARIVRLAIPTDQVESAKLSFQRGAVHADIMKYIVSLWPAEPVLDDMLYFANCRRRHVAELAAKGWLEIVPKERVVVSSLSDELLRRWVRKHAARASRQAAVLEALIGHPGAVSVSELPPVPIGVLKKLDEKDLLRLSENPPRVRLQLTIPQAHDVIAELERPDRRARVLDFLAQQGGGPLEVSWVYENTETKFTDLKTLADRGLVDLGEIEVMRDPLAELEFVPDQPPPLVEGQRQVWEQIEAGFAQLEAAVAGAPQPAPPPFLLHGVTGSGKTEIYLRAVAQALSAGKQAIILIPEIALTPQTVRRFSARFSGRVAVQHSQMSAGERYDTWRRARAGLIDVIIGPRSALFAPQPRVGLIVVDEEHDEAYKQDPPVRPPYYNARDVAVEYARRVGALCILGSATPDLVTHYRAQQKTYTLLTMPRRIMGHAEQLSATAQRLDVQPQFQPLSEKAATARYAPLPAVKVVDMRQELRAGNRSIFSRALHRAITSALDRKEQVILFLNRRGQATYVFCRDCGHTVSCPNCDTPFTYHRTPEELVCHRCNTRRRPPRNCPNCGSSRVRYFGIGTERVEVEVKKVFPEARVLRWDWDMTRTKGAHEHILRRFGQREADVLVGTQMVAKGLDLPLVTLVGVVSADLGLTLPDYRAAERTFQLLTQVAGRAGRGLLGGQVVLQTYMPEHYAIRAAAAHDYDRFYSEELQYRREQAFPPYTRLVRIIGRHPKADRIERDARFVADIVHKQLRDRKANSTTVIGPAPCFFSRIAREYRWQLVLRGPNPTVLLDFNLPEGWWVEIDPLNLL